MNYSSFGGNITLIKVTLSNLPVYHVSFQDASESCEKIISYQKEFSMGRV